MAAARVNRDMLLFVLNSAHSLFFEDEEDDDDVNVLTQVFHSVFSNEYVPRMSDAQFKAHFRIDPSKFEGGVFFGDSSVNSEFSDLQQLHATPENGSTRSFQPLRTVLAAGFQLLVVVGIVVCGVVMATSWPKDRSKCEPYFILMYIHAVFWCISFIVHHHLHLEHHTLRLNGYLDFYKETGSYLAIPFHIVSLWNAVILVIGTIFHQMYEHFEDECKATGFLTPVYYLIAIIAVEGVVLLPFVGSYIAKVLKFNKKKPVPDVLQDDWVRSINENGLERRQQTNARL